mmetsp:Transcript_11487/g.28935  ORF Transcript_11487/g.28935 Transcript_11487/m.28935 type:complete len:744 (-) Transcript_11487:52-2283(-)
MSSTSKIPPEVWGQLLSVNSGTYPNLDLNKPEIWIGREQGSCDYFFNDGTISKRHCRVYTETVQGVLVPYVEDTSSNGTFLDGKLVGKGNKVAMRNSQVLSLVIPSLDHKSFNSKTLAFVYLSRDGMESGLCLQLTEEEIEKMKKAVVEFQSILKTVCNAVADVQSAQLTLLAKEKVLLDLLGSKPKASGTIINIMEKVKSMSTEASMKTMEIFVNKLKDFEQNEIRNILEVEKVVTSYLREKSGLQSKMKKETDAFKEKQHKDRMDELEKQYEFQMVKFAAMLREFDFKREILLNDAMLDFLLVTLNRFREGSSFLNELETELNAKKILISRSVIEKENTYKQRIDCLKQLRTTSKENVREKQGYLMRKGKPLWFVVLDGYASYYKSWKDQTPQGVIDIMLASTKPIADPKKKFMFELNSPHVTLQLQAVSKEDYDQWMLVFKNSIQYQLQQVNKMKEQPARANRYATIAQTITTSPAGGLVLGPLQQLQLACEENSFCADCGMENPDWMCIRVGVLICHECSGVHRSLGTHVSKVRSLTLDKWEPQLMQLMKLLGNHIINAVYEEVPHPKYPKLTPKSSREDRERYIEAKYKKKKMVADQRPNDPELSKNFYMAAMAGGDATTVPQLAKLIARGADLNWANKDENGSTVLHYAVAADDILVTEMLLQNDANINVMDAKGWTPIFYAAQSDSLACARLLLNRGSVASTKDAMGMTPSDVAMKNQSMNVHMVLANSVPTMSAE